MIEGINRGAFPVANLTNPVTPISQYQQGENSSLSSSDTKEKSCLSTCWSCCKTLLQLIFFPITLPYLVFKNLCCPSPEKAKEGDEETGSSTILVGTYGAPYPVRKRQGEHELTISEAAEGHPMEVMTRYAGRKVATVLDLSRNHEKTILVPELQLHQLIEKQMDEVTESGKIAALSNYPFTPKKLEGTVKIQSDFRADIIIAESVPYPKTDEKYIISGVILEGFNSKQIDSLTEALRGQLYSAYNLKAEVLILDHFGSHLGTPSKVTRALYEKLLEEEFAGCFKEVIFVKRTDDDAPRPSAPRRTVRDAVQLKDLKR